MRMESLTRRQQETFDYIVVHQRQRGIAPTVREICQHFGLASPGGVHRILRVLVDKGYVEAGPGEKRNWRPAERQVAEPTLPIIRRISAGLPIEAVENRDDELLVNPAEFGAENCFGVTVRGDSMVGKHIVEGDVAVIRPCSVVNSGEIAAVLVEDMITEVTLKIFYRHRSAIELRAANDDYAPMIFKGKDRARVSVVGKLVGVVRRVV
jgi:repressor LexA